MNKYHRLMAVALAAGLATAAPLSLAHADDAKPATAAPSTWDKVEGNWTEMKGHVKEQWGNLTDDDLLQIQGKRQQLVGKIQARYGVSLAEAEKQVTTFENRVAR
jgi:uncharacterized protein YjbJ (UPF0337 family)